MSESFLKSLGLNKTIVANVLNKYGDKTEEKIKENPYVLMDFDGVAFLTADKAALLLGVKKHSADRYNRAMETVFKEAASSSGHTWLPKEHLRSLMGGKLGVSFEDIDLNKLNCNRAGNSYFLNYYYNTELKINNHLKNFERPVRVSNFEIDNINLDLSQKDIIRKILQEPKISILTGGAGVGKTTVLKGILKVLSNKYPCLNFSNDFDNASYEFNFSVGLIAPTGKAARRISEVTGHNAYTIHRYLKSDKEGKFKYNIHNKTMVDFLIIDECSMIDVFLLGKLLEAVSINTKILFVGDYQQLAPVGAGNPFKDMITSNIFDTHRLTKVYRSEAWQIPYAASEIQKGNMFDFDIKEKLDDQSIVQFVPAYTNEEILLKTVEFFEDNQQILIPMKRGDVGAEAINAAISRNIPRKKEDNYNKDVLFNIGDRVINTKNNYEIGVMNGEIGIIESIDTHGHIVVRIDDNLIPFDSAAKRNLIHAWAITVHKSQGSEFDVVVLPLSPSHTFMLTRNLLYTAITRAKKQVIIIGDEGVLLKTIRNNKEDKRFTFLEALLLKNS